MSTLPMVPEAIDLLVSAGVTRARIGALTGAARETVRRWALGTQRPTAGNLARLQKAAEHELRIVAAADFPTMRERRAESALTRARHMLCTEEQAAAERATTEELVQRWRRWRQGQAAREQAALRQRLEQQQARRLEQQRMAEECEGQEALLPAPPSPSVTSAVDPFTLCEAEPDPVF